MHHVHAFKLMDTGVKNAKPEDFPLAMFRVELPEPRDASDPKEAVSIVSLVLRTIGNGSARAGVVMIHTREGLLYTLDSKRFTLDTVERIQFLPWSKVIGNPIASISNLWTPLHPTTPAKRATTPKDKP